VKELPFDHVYNPSAQAQTVVMYTDIENELFKAFHTTLKKLAEEGVVKYILRYKPAAISVNEEKPLFVSGYGVELMLKKTDYIVIDDREVETGISPKAIASNLDRAEKPLEGPKSDSNEEIPVITPLHTSELSQLGYQAVQLIMSSSSPLDTLQHLSQDFPSQSSKIAAAKVDDDLIAALKENTRVIPGGENLFWMNGMNVARDKVEAFNLLSLMRRERGLINSLRQLGLSNKQAVEFLSHPKIAEKVEIGTTNRFDVRDTIEGGDVIVWMNDLEKDSRYTQWPQGVQNVSRLKSG
jgi:UDP-glucose:glycoprotein glucosyltransferase